MKKFLITLTGISGFLRLLLLPPDIGGALGNASLPRSIAKEQIFILPRRSLPERVALVVRSEFH